MSPQWEAALGYSLKDLLTRPYTDILHPDDLIPTQAAVAGLMQTGRLDYFTNRYRHADGSYRTLSWWGRVHAGHSYGVARDVTDLTLPLDTLSGGVHPVVMDAAEFRRLRAASGLTQESAAAILEVSERTVARWEAGKASPNGLEAESIRRRLARRIDGENRPRRDVRSV